MAFYLLISIRAFFVPFEQMGWLSVKTLNYCQTRIKFWNAHWSVWEVWPHSCNHQKYSPEFYLL